MPAPFCASRALEFGDLDLVLLSLRRSQPVTITRQHDADWILLCHDGLALRWGWRRRNGYPASGRFLRTSQSVAGDRPQVGRVPQPAAATPAQP